jgi:sugar O-acyltransferase (sialic acid O-acetyltransferase NeuD family)
MKLAILGAGHLGIQLAHLSQTFGAGPAEAFFDDTLAVGTTVSGVAVAGGLDGGALNSVAEWCAARDDARVLVAIGYRHLEFRARLSERCRELGLRFATLVAPNAWVDPTARIGEGSVVHAGCVVDQRAELGANVFLNPGCVVCHDASIGADSMLGPSVTLCGFARAGRRTFLGAGTVVSDGRTVGDGGSTGAGAVVVRDIAPGELHAGVPARLLRRRD